MQEIAADLHEPNTRPVRAVVCFCGEILPAVAPCACALGQWRDAHACEGAHAEPALQPTYAATSRARAAPASSHLGRAFLSAPPKMPLYQCVDMTPFQLGPVLVM